MIEHVKDYYFDEMVSFQADVRNESINEKLGMIRFTDIKNQQESEPEFSFN